MSQPKTMVEPVYFWLPRFLLGVETRLTLWGLAKGCLCGPHEMYGRGPYPDRVWKPCGVLIGFSPAGCTSIRITATLGYDYRFFATVST
jgi:hypothetical protein